MKRGIRGFTLVELVVTVIILGIAMAIAIPAMRDLLLNQKMKAATFDLITTVMFARSEAMKFGGTPNASISIVAPDDDFGNGWCVVFTSASACDLSAPGPDVMRVNMPVRNVTYTWSTTAVPITFNRTGRLNLASPTVPPVKIDVKDVENSAAARCVTIDVSGNATSQLGACS